MRLAVAILALVTLQRLGELVVAERNTRRLLARGAVESGAAHYPAVVLLHAGWLLGLWGLAWDRPTNLGWLAVFIALQIARVWVIATLGERWTTRIITLRDAPLVTGGPYRFLAHPNYAVVIGEMAVLPLVFGLVGYAVVFSALNAAVLWIRIRREGEALALANGGDGRMAK